MGRDPEKPSRPGRGRFTRTDVDGRVARVCASDSHPQRLMRLRKRRTRRRHQIQVTYHPIYLARLPADFSEVRLVQLSDIHHGLYTRLSEVERAVELTNRLEPDLVALTGDFVSNSPRYIAPVAAALGRLRARLGVFAVLGNHDYRVGADAVTAALERHGIEVLRNRHVRLRRNGSCVTLAGVDDVRYGEDNLRLALLGADADSSTLLLCHNPALLPLAAARGIDLVLSGHTHGGQLDLPRLRTFARTRGMRMPFPFHHGWDQLGETQIYISRGLGTVIVPLRVRCPAEIPVLRLQAVLRPGSGPANSHATSHNGAAAPS